MPVAAINKPDFLAGTGVSLWVARYRADFLAMIDNNRNFNDNLYKDMKTNSVKGFRPTKCPPHLEIKSGISAAKKELLRMEQLFFMTIKNL